MIDDLKVGDLVLLKCYESIRKYRYRCITENGGIRRTSKINMCWGFLADKRRLSLLLTILNEPRLIFLDEPTTGMDLESVDNFWHLLEEQNFTSLVVTHDFNQIDHFFYKSPDF